MRAADAARAHDAAGSKDISDSLACVRNACVLSYPILSCRTPLSLVHRTRGGRARMRSPRRMLEGPFTPACMAAHGGVAGLGWANRCHHLGPPPHVMCHPDFQRVHRVGVAAACCWLIAYMSRTWRTSVFAAAGGGWMEMPGKLRQLASAHTAFTSVAHMAHLMMAH